MYAWLGLCVTRMDFPKLWQVFFGSFSKICEFNEPVTNYKNHWAAKSTFIASLKAPFATFTLYYVPHPPSGLRLITWKGRTPNNSPLSVIDRVYCFVCVFWKPALQINFQVDVPWDLCPSITYLSFGNTPELHKFLRVGASFGTRPYLCQEIWLHPKSTNKNPLMRSLRSSRLQRVQKNKIIQKSKRFNFKKEIEFSARITLLKKKNGVISLILEVLLKLAL